MMKIQYNKEAKEIVMSYALITNGVIGEYAEIVKFTTTGTYSNEQKLSNDHALFQTRLDNLMDANEVAIGFCSYSQTPNTLYSDIQIIKK